MSFLTPTFRSPRASRKMALLGCALALAACDKSGGGAEAPSEDKHPLLGSPAPDFDLPAQSGAKRASLANAEGKVALVDFWATWCEPCRVSFPHYEALAKKFESDVVVVGVSEDDEPDGIQAFAKETGATFALAWDANKTVAAGYRPESMPTIFIVDQHKLVRYVHSGFRPGDEKVIEDQVRELLK